MHVVLRLIIAALFVSGQLILSAQPETPSAAWLLPGASWHPSKNIRLLSQAGYNRYLRAGLGYQQGFITIHKNIVVNPAYMYYIQKKAGSPQLSEHYLMNSVILQAAGKKLFTEDRNMIWNRFTVGAPATHYYRNRLKVGRLLKILQFPTKLYVYDELYYLFNNKLMTRNRIAAGFSADLAKHINTEITYVRQWDRYSGNLNLFFIQVTWQR